MKGERKGEGRKAKVETSRGVTIETKEAPLISSETNSKEKLTGRTTPDSLGTCTDTPLFADFIVESYEPQSSSCTD